MKWINPIKRLLLPAVVLTLASCRKHDPVCIGCPPVPDCRAVSLTNVLEPVEIYSVVTGPGNVPVTLNCRTNLTHTVPHTLDVRYVGRNLYLIETGTTDTLLSAKLDECGRPVSSVYIEQPGFEPLHTRYYYNIQGRLTKYVWAGWPGGTHTLAYDHRGNVLSITGESAGLEYKYTYDYTQPVSKGIMYAMEMRGWATEPLSLLEWLGHIDLKPRNLRTTSESWSGTYHMQTINFSNYTFNGGRVHSYETDGGVGKYVIGWDCNNAGAK
ncbi:hypothetical protein DLD77_04585 [Chitinophaga alhagiae]|uniref:DUF4595 domain-containing protein n=1 Tax=Chitinophaga alhagiae TaxID=2203219 RepID=A0ABM6WAL5_9BACT|nr:hypothetical protein [Chitinophaga alhagiae]AWO01023.1 hypothetical protein DLD77_04585 [Chitinophaga alhagiae]